MACDSTTNQSSDALGASAESALEQQAFTSTEVLNNAIDWLSRPFGAGAVSGKPAAVIGTAGFRDIYLLGRTVGTTNMALYNADRELIAVIDVEVTYDVSGMREALNAALPGSAIQIRSVGGRIMLQGRVLLADVLVLVE